MAARFSIIIPTRNRSTYLAKSIQSVISNEFRDFELIVSDNSDPAESEKTLATVCGFDDSRIAYIRPPSPPLAMSRHWEFALEKAAGEFIIVIGDDDGLLPSTLQFLDKALRDTLLEVIQWPFGFYTWPNPAVGEPSVLSIRSYLWDASVSISTVSCEEAFTDYRVWQSPHDVFPMLYNSVVSNAVCRRMLSMEKPVLRSNAPDLYSGMLIARLVSRFGRSSVPLSLAGRSPASNGAANLEVEDTAKNPIARDFRELNRRAGLEGHRLVPSINVMAAEVAASFELFYENTGTDRGSLPTDSVEFVSILLGQIVAHPSSISARRSMLQIAEGHYHKSPKLVMMIKEAGQHIIPAATKSPSETCFFGSEVCLLSGSLVRLEDVAAASIIAEAILGLSRRRVSAVASRQKAGTATHLKDLAQLLMPPLLWRFATWFKRSVYRP